MDFEAIHELVNSLLEKAVSGTDVSATPKALIVDKEYIFDTLQLLHATENLYFDMLSCLTGVDNGVEAGTMEVVYNLYSIPYGHSIMVKVVLPRENPTIASVESIWKTANWHEREAFDLLGIQFEGHPDMRRILLPSDWVGHPLRKDYSTDEYYHGVKIDY
jgi:NADH-quinone oxidoreductase subunit C